MSLVALWPGFGAGILVCFQCCTVSVTYIHAAPRQGRPHQAYKVSYVLLVLVLVLVVVVVVPGQIF